MDELTNDTQNEQHYAYPDHVIKGVKESLKQANEGLLTPFVSVREMLGIQQVANLNPKTNVQPHPIWCNCPNHAGVGLPDKI
jgi:hypothetical protein